MLQRVKLMRMKSELNLTELYRFFLGAEFNNEDSFGFYNVEFYGPILKAHYVEKEVTSLHITDPFGDIHEQFLISYNDFSFEIGPLEKGVYLLSVYNPPKTIKKFLDRISAKFDYNLTFSLVNLDISNLVSEISSDKNISLLKISRVKASGLRFSNDATGCIELVSIGNALEDLEKNVMSKKFVIDKIKGAFFLYGERIAFEVSKSGLISTDGDAEAIRLISYYGFNY